MVITLLFTNGAPDIQIIVNVQQSYIIHAETTHNWIFSKHQQFAKE